MWKAFSQQKEASSASLTDGADFAEIKAAMEIYISRAGQRVGPFSLEEINRQLAAGTLTPHDLGWSESSPGWKPLLSFAGAIMPGGASSTATSIGIATPVTFGLPEFAGFWIRFLAHAIDLVILSVFALVIAIWFRRPDGSPSALGFLLQAVMIVLYLAGLWCSPMQATAGQRICGIKVMHADGERISFGRGVVRVIGMMLSGLILGIGYFMAAFTERKRALHDMMADTCVVKDSSVGRWFNEARTNLRD